MDSSIFGCFVNFPAAQENLRNPTDMQWIQQNQLEDLALFDMRQWLPQFYVPKTIHDLEVLCFKTDPAAPEHEWRICIPSALLNDFVRWFHLVQGHAEKSA